MFLGGDKDFNVPLLGSEQMYQALRNVGTESQLIVYPGENHGLARPSFRRDRMQRYLDWYAKFLKHAPAAASTSVSAAAPLGSVNPLGTQPVWSRILGASPPTHGARGRFQ